MIKLENKWILVSVVSFLRCFSSNYFRVTVVPCIFYNIFAKPFPYRSFFAIRHSLIQIPKKRTFVLLSLKKFSIQASRKIQDLS
jgi:hypothetical protein